MKGLSNILVVFVAIFTQLFFVSTYANPIDSHLDHVDISAGLGATWWSSNNTTLAISSYETDKVLVNGASNAQFLWRIGFGKQVAPMIHLQASLYQSQQSINGQVWQFQRPEFNNYTYQSTLSSWRLMFESRFPVLNLKKYTFYPIVGIGPAWNTISYKEHVTGLGVSNTSRLNLSDRTQAQFTYDVGAGSNIALNERLKISLEYLFTQCIGKASPSHHSSNVLMSSPPAFNVLFQSVILGLTWKI